MKQQQTHAILGTKALSTLLELLAIDSPSGQEGRIAANLIGRLSRMGFISEQDPAGNIYATLSATPGREQEPMIMFNCHMDTVPPAVGVHPITADGELRSDGTTALGADDKAGIAAVLTALDAMLQDDLPHPPLMVLFTVSEETGLSGARMVEVSRLGGVDRGYTIDASGPAGTVVVQAPSKYRITATFHGRAAHAGFSPENGISAISIACRAIDNMKLLRIDPETTANIGSITGGGSTNIVCDTATVVMETRSLVEAKIEAQAEHMKQCCLQAAKDFGGTCDVDIDRLYFLYAHSGQAPVIQAVAAACGRLNLPFVTKPTTGGSDANVFNRAGIPVVVLSAGYRNAHSVQETLDLSEFERLTALVLELMTAFRQ